jgi:long-chain fatty acid transport protein
MRKLALIAATMAVFIASPAYATNGMRMIGFGPVQNSMGGASVGATLDAASMVSNPAGLVDLGRRLDFAGQFFKPTVSYSATGFLPGAIVANDGATLDSGRGGSPIPAIGIVTPLDDRLVVGVGVYGTAGMGVDYPANLFNGVTYTSYLQGRLTPSVAYRLSDRVSAGVTLNGMVAQMKYDVAAGAGQTVHDTATALGIGATVGVKVRPVKMLAFGAAYETKSWFQDFSFTVASRPNPFAPGSEIPGGTDKLTFHQPQSATVGVEVTPIEMLLVAADVQWIDWSGTMGSGLPQYSTDPNATGAMPFNMSWSDQWVLKLGAQVSPLKGLQIRAGYNYGKMPLDPSRAFENLAFPAVAEHHVTGGIGYALSRSLTFNVAGMYAFNATIAGSNGAPPPPLGGTGQGITAYTTQMSQLELDAGVTYRF